MKYKEVDELPTEGTQIGDIYKIRGHLLKYYMWTKVGWQLLRG